MYETKVNLNIALPGRVMLSEQECSRKTRKPLLYTKGKKKGEPVKDKNGNQVWYTAIEADPAKTDHFILKVQDENKNEEVLSVYTRKCRSAKQTINICKEAYERMISPVMPDNFRPSVEHLPQELKESTQYKTKSAREIAWLYMTPTDRLEWHLKDYAKSLGGIMINYIIYDD